MLVITQCIQYKEKLYKRKIRPIVLVSTNYDRPILLSRKQVATRSNMEHVAYVSALT